MIIEGGRITKNSVCGYKENWPRYNVRLELRKGDLLAPRDIISPEQIIDKLCEVEILLNGEAPLGKASKKIVITEQTYYRWRKEYGILRIEQAERLKSLETDDAWLKKLMADLPLDNAILKGAADGNF